MEKVEISHSIKNSLLKICGNLVFVFLGCYLLTLIDLSELKNLQIKDYILPLVSILFIFSFGKNAIIELLNANRKIILSKNGIELNKRLFDWRDIKKQKVVSKVRTTPKYNFRYSEFYLTFQYKSENIEINIDDYKTSAEEVDRLLKKFSNC